VVLAEPAAESLMHLGGGRVWWHAKLSVRVWRGGHRNSRLVRAPAGCTAGAGSESLDHQEPLGLSEALVAPGNVRR
jgi:hypothetical protein